MKPFKVDKIMDNKDMFYVIRSCADHSIVSLPTKYLMHRKRANASPNTIRRSAYSLTYYLDYLDEKGLHITDIFAMKYDEQHRIFTDFLQWLKQAQHSEKKVKMPSNFTCDSYLQDVFGFYNFLSLEYEQFGNLRVLSNQVIKVSNSYGIMKSISIKRFRGYLKKEEHRGRSIEQDKIITLLDACANCRDQLLLLLLAETGFRIGEVLGIDYTQDIDYQKRVLKVRFRQDNENGARAKYAECRSALVSKDTFDVLLYYLSENRNLLKGSNHLFVNLSGETQGAALHVNAVYAMLRRLEKKTGVKATPHMLRHYFANQRRKSGWDLPLISKALGHKSITTTEKYLNIAAEELIEASDQYYEKNQAIFMVDKLL